MGTEQAAERDVVLVGFTDCCALDLVGPADVFATAVQVAGRPLYRSVVTATRPGPFATESGVQLVAEAGLDQRVGSAHTLLVGGGNGFPAAMADEVLVAAVATAGAAAARVTSVCSGAFLLAEAGLLRGRRATTHWANAGDLAERFPDITVVADELYVTSGRVTTAAGVTAGIDLALALVAQDHGEALARAVARRMVVYLKRSGGQSQFSERIDPETAEDPGIAAVLRAVADDPAGAHAVADMAGRAGMSERTFARRFRAVTGTTPGRWVERVRIDAARAALEQTTLAPPAVAAQCGFVSYDTMRQAFRRVLGVSPARYRTAHSPLSVPSG